MFPIDIPVGTTIDEFMTRVVPDAHARFVKEEKGASSTREHTAVVRLLGGPSFTYSIRGPHMTVTQGETERAALWLVADALVLERFLADWSGPKKYLPRFDMPVDSLVLFSDPRILSRLAMVSGRVEIALADFEGQRIAMTVGVGAAAQKGIETMAPDVVIEAKMVTFEKFLEGKLAPEDALADGDVQQRGKKLVALQLALAVAPFFPVHR